MDYTEYYRARNEIVKILKEDLLGPVYEDEIIDEPPVSYYLLGKIYPHNIKDITDEVEYTTECDELFEEEETFALGNSTYPSAMGLTFAISKPTKMFSTYVVVSKYNEIIDESDNKKKSIKWKREELQFQHDIYVQDLYLKRKLKINLQNKLELQVQLYEASSMDDYKITVTLVNRETAGDGSYNELSRYTYFQPVIKILNISDGHFCKLKTGKTSNFDEEIGELDLLYREYVSFASGHGCSVKWDIDNGKEYPSELSSDIIPEYDVLLMKPAQCILGPILRMKYLVTAEKSEILEGITELVCKYEEWIKRKEDSVVNLEESLHSFAYNNIENCKKVCRRLSDSISILNDEKAFRAFRYANEVMLMQRKTTNTEIDEDTIMWYPFQLAFILQEIESIIYRKSKSHDIVDLLWFPTGGGKTEAYLGIAAFTLFYRRLRELEAGREDTGVAVIMRYTLRLLSFQQFERASAMICACELIRKRENLGYTTFGIGLWAGNSLTPNSLEEARDYLLKRRVIGKTNPVQIKKCPWCGTVIGENGYEVDRADKRMLIKCPNVECDFHDGLPIFLIDEEIYKHRPSFLIGTVDKFVQVAYKDDAAKMLGVGHKLGVELIIQDELHLISGPLGTITGIYEAGIQKICEKEGIKPKILASTATIRNAKNQIKALYGREYAQFPPQGLEIGDSFFAETSVAIEKPSRKYVGIMAPGIARATIFNRVMGSLLFATRYLVDCGYSEDVIDSFWTETGYFNNLKELGSALIRIIDSVQDRFSYLKNTKFYGKYDISSNKEQYTKKYEMTSRNNSSDLGNVIQNELKIRYKKDGSTEPYDFLMASNMISVGVDVARLGCMLVVGQPIKTSEYIQATSRVGRTTPGLVITMYYPNRSRDKSHYEQFIQYHSTFYKYVEATSVTPFSDRARDRALQALYILLARYSVPELMPNEGASRYRMDIEKMKEVRNYIKEYVEFVDPFELDNVMKDIDEIEKVWEERTCNSDLVYYNYNRNSNSLYRDDYEESDRFRMMNSMRSVEPNVDIYTEE